MGIHDLIGFVVDDNHNKQLLYMPGSDLQIKPSESLISAEVDCCLLTSNLESEKAVVNRNNKFIVGGGIFGSIFPQSEKYFQNITRLEFQN